MKNPKKMAVLAMLQQLDRPIDLPTLLEKLGPGYVERTVRRWLNELVTAGLADKYGQKKGTRYQAHIDKECSSNFEQKSIFSLASQESLNYVQQPIFKRQPVSYREEWLNAYIPNQTNYLSTKHKQVLFELGSRLPANEPAGTYIHKIYNRLLIDLSYHSSRLEGNTYSLIETERLIIEGQFASGKLDLEGVMILNHKEAIRYLIDNAHRLQIVSEEIYTLHYLLSDGLVLTKQSGQVRDHGVRIGGSTYIPIESPIKMKRQIEVICQKAREIGNPFEQSLFLLVHLAYLQAFTDVNKRTSRLAANIPLIRQNLIPLSFSAVSKDDYIAAMLAIYELNKVQPLIDLYCYSYQYTCQEYKVTAQSLGFDEIRLRYRQKRRDVLRQIILAQLIEPALTECILQYSQMHIPPEDRQAFIEDVQEDIQHISPQRIVGMGVTDSELQSWLKRRAKDIYL